MKCSELLKVNKIDNYYEFLFILGLGAEMGRRGSFLDISDICIKDSSLLSKKDLAYFHYLKDMGYITDGSNTAPKLKKGSNEEKVARPDLYFDVNSINDLKDVLFKVTDNGYEWSLKYAYNVYGEDWYSIINRKIVSNTLIHLLAYMYVGFYMGDIDKKPIFFIFEGSEVVSNHMYLELYGLKSCSYLKDVFHLVLNSDRDVDNDFFLLFNIALHAGTYKLWSCKEKFKAFDDLGLKEGSIAILYDRGNTSGSNIVGSILGSSVIRIDKVARTLGRVTGWYVTKYTLNSTKEEIEEAYSNIDEAYRYGYKDMLNSKIKGVKEFLSFENVGVGIHFESEENLIMPIENSDTVTKLVSVNGKRVSLEMSTVDAIYWLLQQYKVPFDSNLFKEYYNEGKPLLWDTCDPTQVRIYH